MADPICDSREAVPRLLSQFLHAVRWILALAVVSAHATNMFMHFADIGTASHWPSFYAWWFFANAQTSHQAVIGFFVISGYLVGGEALAQIARAPGSWGDYFLRRLARVYTVLIPAIFLTFFLDTLGRAWFADTGVYDFPMYAGHFSPFLILADLANVEQLYAGFYGTNAPLWSLACEFWYYVTFPLLILPLASGGPVWARALGFAVGLALFAALGVPTSFFKFGYALWAMGAFASRLEAPWLRSRWLSLGLLLAAFAVIRLTVRGPNLEAFPWLQDASDMTIALLFVNLALAIRFGPQSGWSWLHWRWHKPLANFSFSLYSTHAPVLVFVVAAINAALGPHWAPAPIGTPAHWAALAATLTLLILCGYGFSRLTEAHTGAVRNAIARLLARARLPSPEF